MCYHTAALTWNCGAPFCQIRKMEEWTTPKTSHTDRWEDRGVQDAVAVWTLITHRWWSLKTPTQHALTNKLQSMLLTQRLNESELKSDLLKNQTLKECFGFKFSAIVGWDLWLAVHYRRPFLSLYLAIHTFFLQFWYFFMK